ncbi:hypothetical protein ACFOET_13390 [Parapedobacter deserti]|uniref:FAS1 domain-containing protein n=2 Tax=Parapedobacter deserti TaxID=1912957 RepID=A0ABV7JP78_9SPHI
MILRFCLVIMTVVGLLSCEKNDYMNDGGPSDAFVNMTTYDFLKSHPKFDSLVRVIDQAGLKDEINGDITFFASTNYSVASYVAVKRQEEIIKVGDENIDFGIKDIPATELRDSLQIYMFDGKINREQMSTEGAYYTSRLGAVQGVRFMIKLRRVNIYSTFLDYVDYVNLTKVNGTLDSDEPDQSSIPENLRDLSYDCQTSGIITTTGIIHVLSDNHRLFFNAQSFSN